jgi:AcrR family transcriptional regulator
MNAAMRLFGEFGFDGTSTRDIAGAASLNTPALQYYFNNKEGLYAACAELIVCRGWTLMRDAVTSAERLLRAGARDAELIDAFCRVQSGLADFLGDAGGDWLLWRAREQAGAGSTPDFLLRHRKAKRMLRVNHEIVARLRRAPLRDAETLVHELALDGQLLHFRFMRVDVLQTLRWRNIDAADLTLIKRVIRSHSLASLRALVRQRARVRRSGGEGMGGGS